MAAVASALAPVAAAASALLPPSDCLHQLLLLVQSLLRNSQQLNRFLHVKRINGEHRSRMRSMLASEKSSPESQ